MEPFRQFYYLEEANIANPDEIRGNIRWIAVQQTESADIVDWVIKKAWQNLIKNPKDWVHYVEPYTPITYPITHRTGDVRKPDPEWMEGRSDLISVHELKSDKVAEIRHVIDWLNALQRESYVSGDRQYYKAFKSNWPTAVQKADQWVVEMNKKLSAEEDAEGVHTLMSFGDGYRVVWLESQKARDREGKLMNHCVACYGEDENMGDMKVNENMFILSLRDPENKPHVTMALENVSETVLSYIADHEESYDDELPGQITKYLQDNPPFALTEIKGNSNQQVKSQYRRYIVDFILKFDIPVMFDGENIGVESISNDLGEMVEYCEAPSTISDELANMLGL